MRYSAIFFLISALRLRQPKALPAGSGACVTSKMRLKCKTDLMRLKNKKKKKKKPSNPSYEEEYDDIVVQGQ